MTRRGLLFRMAGFVFAALGGSAFKPGKSVACVLTPEQTEGPYYIAGERLRRNITDGRPGAPMLLRTFVVDAKTCKPIKNAAVDIWHADASGVYSGFGAGAGNRTAMRGVQRTNAQGLATFRSVYPGWYQGRAVHVHVKVHVGGNEAHTGQLYFPDRISDAVYRRAPYNRRPNRTVRNPDDSIYRSGGSKSLLSIRRNPAGVYVATIVMGCARS